MKRLALFLLTGMVPLLSFGQASQVTPSNDTGVKPYTTYTGAQENINLSNGNLNLRIPLVSLPGRNGHNFPIALQYDSKMWTPHVSYSNTGQDVIYHWYNDSGGWSTDWPSVERGAWISDENGYLIGHAADVITLPGGGKTGVASPAYTQSSEMDSEDGSFLKLSIGDSGAHAALKDGTMIEFACDYCGSGTHYSGGSATSIAYTDGNRITSSGNQITGSTGAQITFGNNYPSNTTITYKDSNGTPQTITLNYSNLTLFQTTPGQYYTGTTPFSEPTPTSGCGNCTGWIWVYQPALNDVYTLLASIVFPDGSSYQFSYNGYGELTQITYPTGGYTKYTYDAFEHGENFWEYGGFNVPADFREITSKRVCRKTTSDCSPAEEEVTTYSPSVGSPYLNNSQVDVVNPAGQLTRHLFTNTTIGDNWSQYHTPREKMRYIYADNGVTLLRTVETQYNSIEPGQYLNEYLPTSVITTLNDVGPPLVTRTDTQYDTYSATVLWPPNQVNLFGARTRYIDNPLQQVRYDFGQNAAGPPVRITNNTWWKSKWDSPFHIWDRPLTEEVQDGTGTRLSFTQFEYDNFTEGLTPSGAEYIGGTGGTRTAVSRWRNIDGAMLTTRYQYDDARNVRKITDPAGHWTTFSYADNWANATCAPSQGQAAAFPTTIQNQLGHQSVTAYYSCTGATASQLDANLQPTSATYDAMNRPLTSSSPDGGFTQYTYVDPTHTRIQHKQSSGIGDPNQWPTSETYTDGLGRSLQTAVKNGESGSGWDLKTTCYDSRGYVNFSSYPSQQSSSALLASPCSLAGDTFAPDALGRVTAVTHSDGSTILTDYVGRATRVRDEGRDNSGNRVTRVTQMDALGRLTTVCEKSSANQMGGNNIPGACGQDIAETGFLTLYLYDIHDAAGSATQISQPGLANRYFVNDSLGQLVKATNPESGMTQYSYNDDGTLGSRIRPKPNQYDPGTTVTTSYFYDVLHRLKETHYDDNTPWVYRLYDQASATSGQTLENPIGQLTTISANGGQSVSLYSYDQVGRIKSNWQCTPAICGTSFKQLGYGYDLLGNVTSASNGFNVSIGYNYNVGSRLTSVASSLSDASHPATLMSNISYGPFGLASATFGNGVNESRGYTARGLLNSISDTVTVTQPAVPGNGSVTISGSERTIGGPPATVSSGSVTLSGNIQSTQVVSQPAVGGSGSVNISGTEQNTQATSYAGTPGQGTATITGSGMRGYDDNCTCYVYDSGTVYLSVNGVVSAAGYGYLTSAAGIAATLANGLNYTGTSSGGNIWMTARSNGANTNYTVSMWEESDRPDIFGSGSFGLSWTNFSGGTDPTYYTLYDSGTVTAAVNGFSKSTSYGQGSTTATVASGLASAFNADGNSPVTGSASGASLTLTSKATGASTNYSLSASSATGLGGYFAQPSFAANPASSTLLGGRDATYSTLYDSGSVNVTVNGVTKSTSYGQNSTLAGLASALATAFNNDAGAPVTATASGAVVTLTSRSTGVAANYPLSSTSSTSQGAYFSHPSFSGSASSSTLTGGQDAGASINDTGSVSITVNGFAKSVPYGQTSTASSVASALSSAFNGDVNSPVSTTVSGGTVTLTAKTGGAASNYALSSSSATTSGSFTGTSFPAAASGGGLTGGADSAQIPTTPYSASIPSYAPNGNILAANDNVNGNWSYGYDEFNRLATSSKTGASYTYAYDRYGNRWQQNGPYTMLLTFSSGNNRMDGYSYDAAGNLLNDGNGHSFTYDAENRIINVGSDVSYVYDGDGRRVRKTVSGTSTDFFYDLDDHVVAQMNSSGGWDRGEVFAGGRHIATYANSTTYFNHSDWLGTERSRTTTTGVVCQTTTSLPYGDGTSNPVNSCNPTPDLFTGKERDTETGLDYFGARFYSNQMGRWMSPDWADYPTAVPYAEFGDPQSLNLYGYVRNNPMSHSDADGHSPDWWQKLWNKIKYGHAVTDAYLNAALKDDATKAKDTMRARGVRAVVNGKEVSSDAYFKGKSNQQIVDAFNDYEKKRNSGQVQVSVALVTTLQSGNSNTITKATARSLNEHFGENLEPREWGRALESLKNHEGLPPDFHGKILSNGDFVNPETGVLIGNMGHYIP
jgi:RHS repeat-associated protein